MFQYESTDNLLDNLEKELTELIDLQKPKARTPVKSPIQVIPKEITPEKQNKSPPIPAKRNTESSQNVQPTPVPAARRNPPLDKKLKNNENEIIQLQSLSSEQEFSISSESQKHHSYISSTQSQNNNSIVTINEKQKKKDSTNQIIVVREGDKVPDDTFFVIKHGKLTDKIDDEDNEDEQKTEEEILVEKEIEEIPLKTLSKPKSDVTPEKFRKKKISTKKKIESSVSSSTTTASHVSVGTTTESSSETEEVSIPKMSLKKLDGKKKHDKKKKLKSGTTTEETASKKIEEKQSAASNDKVISEFIFKVIYEISITSNALA